MNKEIDLVKNHEDKQSKGYEILKNFFEKISNTAAAVNKYLKKLLIINLTAGTITSFIAFDWIGSFNTVVILCLLISYIPSFFVIFLMNRISVVESLPEEIKDMESSGTEISKNLNESGLLGSLKEFMHREEKGLKKRIRALILIAPLLYKIKDKLSDIARPDIFISISSVANPFFGFLITLAIVITGIWVILSSTLCLIWLFTI